MQQLIANDIQAMATFLLLKNGLQLVYSKMQGRSVFAYSNTKVLSLKGGERNT